VLFFTEFPQTSVKLLKLYIYDQLYYNKFLYFYTFLCFNVVMFYVVTEYIESTDFFQSNTSNLLLKHIQGFECVLTINWMCLTGKKICTFYIFINTSG